MNAEELAAIRERDANDWEEPIALYRADRRALLAHIDALTAAVNDMPNAVVGDYIDRAAVLAILRGEA